MIEIELKPLSINQAWQGKRYKTPLYKKYCIDLTRMLPYFKVPDGALIVYYEFGLSNISADYDNMIKATQDIISKKYGFNDCKIHQAIINKTKVKKGSEYIKFSLRNKLCGKCWLEVNKIKCECK